MRRLAILLILLGLLWPGMASAIDQWVTTPGGASATFPCSFPDFRVCWWDVTGGGLLVTTQLDTQMCENVSYSWLANIATTAHVNLAIVYENHALTINVGNITAEIIQNKALTGDPATDLYAVYGIDAGFIYARFVMAGAETGRLRVHCHPRIS